ncbi:MAG: histidine phosphatase family protein [Actinomycetota bacterium]|nr:histidine phosphatase family protein [Actinomycetota bacterium]
MTLFVVRHGRTTANAGGLLLGRADPDLDDEGRRQARRIAAVLPPDALVVSSPLGRAFQTATTVSTDVEIDDRLIEMDYGAYDLMPVSEVAPETWQAWRTDADFRPPGGESHNECAARVFASLDEWGREAIDRDVVVVSHVSPIKASVAWALQVPIDVSWRCFVGQASITQIGVTSAGTGLRTSLRSFNDVHHLDAH